MQHVYALLSLAIVFPLSGCTISEESRGHVQLAGTITIDPANFPILEGSAIPTPVDPATGNSDPDAVEEKNGMTYFWAKDPNDASTLMRMSKAARHYRGTATRNVQRRRGFRTGMPIVPCEDCTDRGTKTCVAVPVTQFSRLFQEWGEGTARSHFISLGAEASVLGNGVKGSAEFKETWASAQKWGSRETLSITSIREVCCDCHRDYYELVWMETLAETQVEMTKVTYYLRHPTERGPDNCEGCADGIVHIHDDSQEEMDQLAYSEDYGKTLEKYWKTTHTAEPIQALELIRVRSTPCAADDSCGATTPTTPPGGGTTTPGGTTPGGTTPGGTTPDAGVPDNTTTEPDQDVGPDAGAGSETEDSLSLTPGGEYSCTSQPGEGATCPSDPADGNCDGVGDGQATGPASVFVSDDAGRYVALRGICPGEDGELVYCDGQEPTDEEIDAALDLSLQGEPPVNGGSETSLIVVNGSLVPQAEIEVPLPPISVSPFMPLEALQPASTQRLVADAATFGVGFGMDVHEQQEYAAAGEAPTLQTYRVTGHGPPGADVTVGVSSYGGHWLYPARTDDAGQFEFTTNVLMSSTSPVSAIRVFAEEGIAPEFDLHIETAGEHPLSCMLP